MSGPRDLNDLMAMIGAQSAHNPESMPGPVRSRLKLLVEMFLWKKAKYESVERRDASTLRGEVQALAWALRVLLRPEIQTIAREESER